MLGLGLADVAIVGVGIPLVAGVPIFLCYMLIKIERVLLEIKQIQIDKK